MKNMKALLALLLIAAGLTACSGETAGTPSEETKGQENTPVETTKNDVIETEEAETEYNGFVLDPDVLTLDTENVALFVNGENPTYDKENGCLVFVVPGLIEYDLSERVEVVLTTDGDFSILDGTLVTDKYPSLVGENGYYGAAIQFDYDMIPGDYGFSIKFSVYDIGFKYNMQ